MLDTLVKLGEKEEEEEEEERKEERKAVLVAREVIWEVIFLRGK